uniref:D-isomer specific 2-hydroxyacid dehydrogenase NAD-binding domain-containing protein n=1 Tax=Lates calcarifer TaxID=8187 RepID=A0A4W6G124_LATCA
HFLERTMSLNINYRFKSLNVVVISGGVGIDHLDMPFIISDSTADLAMGLLLASGSHQIQIPQRLMGVKVIGSTLGIIGMGEIGYKIAQRSKGFEMKILYHNRTRK